MSLYSIKGKGWRYDFTLKGERYTEAWFPTKREAMAAEAKEGGSAKPKTEAQTGGDSNRHGLLGPSES